MNISLTSDQAKFIQNKLEIGKYRSVEEVLEIALRLLDEYERSDAEWADDVRGKVSAAMKASEKTDPVDGESFVSDILERFK